MSPSSVVADDDLWSAVGDPVRRDLLDLLLAGDGGTATSLSHALPITRQAVAKHLLVLDRVALVRSVQDGRERRYQVDRTELARAAALMSRVGTAWDARLRDIRRIAESLESGENHPRRSR